MKDSNNVFLVISLIAIGAGLVMSLLPKEKNWPVVLVGAGAAIIASVLLWG